MNASIPRPVKGAFERLEPRAVKVASAVLRGRGGVAAALLPDQPIKLLLFSYRRLVEASRKAPLPLDGLDSVPEAVRNTALRVAQRNPVASFLQVMTEGTATVPTSRLPQVFTATALKAVA